MFHDSCYVIQGMTVFDRNNFFYVQDEVIILIKLIKTTSADTLVSKVRGAFTMPNLAPVAV